MPIIRQITQSEADLRTKDQLVLRAATATHQLATTVARANAILWALPTDRLLAVLNADVPSMLKIFETNTALGLAINDSLDAVGLAHLNVRIPVEPGRSDITFNGEIFVHTPEE